MVVRATGALLLVIILFSGIGYRTIPHAEAQSLSSISLPFAAGTKWKAIQGYNGGTHVPGPERYALDLVRDDGPTAGAEVYAPVSGALWFMHSPGAGNGCLLMKLDGGGGLILEFCHMFAARAFRSDEPIRAGQYLGTIGPNGAVGNNGLAHLHLSMHRTPDYGTTRIPYPFAAPDGLLVEGQSLPPDGTYNQYSCPGASCRGIWTSTLGGAARPVESTPPVAPAAPASLPAATPQGGPPASPTRDRLVVPLRPGVLARVTGGGCLNAREAPSTSATIQRCIDDGSFVKLVEGPVQSAGRTWWRLEGSGWAAEEFLTGIAPPPAALTLGGAATVDAGQNDCLNVRAEPSMAGAVIGCLPSGARVTLSDGPKEADSKSWWQLEGKGWAAAEYLRARDESN